MQQRGCRVMCTLAAALPEHYLEGCSTTSSSSSAAPSRHGCSSSMHGAVWRWAWTAAAAAMPSVTSARSRERRLCLRHPAAGHPLEGAGMGGGDDTGARRP